MTVALWAKLIDIAGKHTLFCTIGQNARSGFHLQVIDGKLKWYLQRGDLGDVFHLETGPVILRDRWFQITVTVDTEANEAKIYVNGGVQAIGVAHGTLPRDWSVKAGFGVHDEGKPLYGILDDVYIYNVALSKEKVIEYVQQFDEIKLFMTPAPMTPTHAPTKAAMTTRRHTTRIKTFTPKHNKSTRHQHTTRRPSTTRHRSSPAKKVKTTMKKTPTKRPTIKTKLTTSTTTSTKSSSSSPATTTTTTPNPITKALPVMDVRCKYGNVYEYTDLKGGLASGNFIDRGLTNNIHTCMELCCAHVKCDLAYMISERCYLVECYTTDLCSIVPKEAGSLSPIIGMVTRPDGPKSKCIELILWLSIKPVPND